MLLLGNNQVFIKKEFEEMSASDNRVIWITENQMRKLNEQAVSFIEDIITYVKGFGQKGKLPSFEGNLRDCYKPYMEQAYEWACEKVDGVRHDGFAYFDWELRNKVINQFKLNKRGLIYVERSIDIDTSRGMDNLGFKSVGECWSWKKLNSRSYCADFSLLNNSVVNVVLCGYVHPDSVDWLETIYLNSYDMKNETEVRMNDNAAVEVSYIKISGIKYKLGGSYLLNASSDKYRKE